MSPLRFLAAVRLSSRRIRAGGSSSPRRLLHQSSNHAGGGAGGSGFSARNAATLEEVIAEEQDLVKEAAMKARFEEWMVEYGRRYKSEEEKAMRFWEFKRHCKNAKRANLLCRGSTTFGPNHLADSTDEEWLRRRGSEREPTLAHRLGYPYRRALELWVLGK